MSQNDSPTLVPADADARQRGLNPDQSFAVSAPAGSGKTGLLTQRILTLLARADHPEEILAMTFTRKAAEEMHQRILSALQLASAGNVPADEALASDVPLNGLSDKDPHQQLTLALAEKVLRRDAKKNWQLLLAPHRLRIQTIDSFCQHIVDQLPLSSGINGALAATENSAFLYHTAVREFFSLLNHPDYQQDLGLLLKHVDNKLFKLERLLVELLSKRNQWLSVLFKSANSSDATEVLKTSLRRTIDDCLEQCQSIIAPYLTELIPLLQFSAQQLSAQQLELTNPAATAIALENFDHNTQASWQQLNAWQQIANLLLTKNAKPDNCQWRKTVDTRLGFPSSKNKNSSEWLNKQAILSLLADFSTNEKLLNCLRDVKALPNIELSEQQEVVASLTRLLPRLVAQFQLTCRECGQCDFDEIAQAAVAALGEAQRPTDLALRLDYQLKHILVDEFQDTSLLQLNLLEKLTAGWEPDDGRTLFVVGDAMQSCYGFRDAKVGLFLRVRRYGIGTIPLEPLDLLVNFRSDSVIVNWVNRVFSQVLPDSDNPRRGAVAYRPARPKPSAPAMVNTSVNAPTNTPANTPARASVQLLGFANQAQHSSEIVKLVQQHLQQSDSNTIAILARGRGHLQSILRTLRDAHIDWEAQDVDALRAQMAIVDLLSLTKACTDFSDRISWLSILRAPWCGLDMQDLHSLVDSAARDRNLLWRQICLADSLPISDVGKNILRRLHTILAAGFGQSHRKPFRQWLEGIWLALGGPAAITNPIEAGSATHFFELLEQYSGAWGIDNWENFERALDRLYAKSAQSARLQVMTLHKSKGLEFDVVILPHLEKTPRSDNKDLLLWEDSVDDHGNINFLLSPLAASGQDNHQGNQLYDFLWREQTIARELESARLLYVACTRAIKHLVLCACLPLDPDSGTVKPPSARSLLAKLWSVVEAEFVIHSDGITHSTDASEGQPALSKLLRLPHDRQAIAFPRDKTLSDYRRPAYFHQDDLPTAEALHNRYQRYCGTVIHRALEQACKQGAENYASADQHPIWSIQLAQLGVPTGTRPALLETIEQAVEQTLADPKGRWLLDNSHQHSVCEWQLSTTAVDSSQLNTREWIIDRSFVDAGVRWVIDYKTSVPRSGQSVDNFLMQEANHYREQLTNYQQVVHSLDPQHPVHVALYFPLLAQFYPLNTVKIQ